jgi:hypothetical protein
VNPQCLLSVNNTPFAPKNKKGGKNLPHNKNSKLDVYPNATLTIVAKNAKVGNISRSESIEKTKKQAEEPLYLKRL